MGQFLWFPDELVLFAQQVLNATEGEQLDLNGALEFRTWYALDRFRRKYGLGSRGTIDYKTQLVLVQRALEELFDEPIPGKYGDLDEETKQAIISFKLRNGMGKD